jgi:hypothetical protein
MLDEPPFIVRRENASRFASTVVGVASFTGFA